MRKLLLFVITITLATSVSAQEISTDQWTHIQKRTATWCPFCGLFGWEFKELMIDTYKDDNVLIWSTHLSSSDLANPTATALVNNYGGSGQPLFFLEGQNLFVSSGNQADKAELVRQTVELNSGFPAFYGTSALATYDGNTISVTAKAKFFEGGNTLPVHLAVYLMRKETVAFQSQQGPNALHRNVVVNHFTDNVFGEVASASGAVAGEEYTLESTLEFPGEDITNYVVVPVVWGEENGDVDYRFYNADVVDIVMSTDVNESFLTDTDVKIMNAGGDVILADINSNESYDGILSIVDMTGKVVLSEQKGIVSGSNSVSIQLPSLPSGMYILNVSNGKQSKSERFLMD